MSRKEAQARAKALLTKLIRRATYSYPHMLSGGQQTTCSDYESTYESSENCFSR